MKNPIALILLATAILVALGAAALWLTSPKQGDHDYAKEFQRLFPAAERNLVNPTGYAGSTEITWRTPIWGRFVLIMSVPSLIGGLRPDFSEFPEMHLLELKSATVLPDGRREASFRRDVKLTERQWDALLQSQGDIRAIIPDADQNHPIPGFDSTWRDQ